MQLPSLDDVLAGAVPFAVPLKTRFRGLAVREGLLIHGPLGWAEFAPFAEYGPLESSRWLAAAIEAAWVGWPAPVRDVVDVNAIIPAVDPDTAAMLATKSGCTSIKVKVAEPGQHLDDDVARIASVRAAMGRSARIRVDANGAWSVAQAETALSELQSFDLEYVEQPCATVAACAHLRSRIDVKVAIDEGIRKAVDPRHVRGLREAADVLVLKVPPLGGVQAALHVAEAYGLPCVVSSALDTSVGLSAGLALAAALPELPYACGLGSGSLLSTDVVTDRLLPKEGQLRVRRPDADVAVLAEVRAPKTLDHWRRRAAAAYEALSVRL